MMKIKQLAREDINNVSDIINIRNTTQYYDSSRLIGEDKLSRILLDENCYLDTETIDKGFNYNPHNDLIWAPYSSIQNEVAEQKELTEEERRQGLRFGNRPVRLESGDAGAAAQNKGWSTIPDNISLLGLIEDDILKAFTVLRYLKGNNKNSYYGALCFMMSDPRFSTVKNNFHLMKESIERLYNSGSGVVYFLTSSALMNTEYGKILNDYDAMNISNSDPAQAKKHSKTMPLTVTPLGPMGRHALGRHGGGPNYAALGLDANLASVASGVMSDIAKNMLLTDEISFWPYHHTVYCLRRKNGLQGEE